MNGLTQDDQIDLKYVPRSPKIFADASDTDSHYKASLPPDETHQGRFARQIVNAEDATESSKGRPRANCQTIVGDSGEVSSRFSGKPLPYHEHRLTYFGDIYARPALHHSLQNLSSSMRSLEQGVAM